MEVFALENFSVTIQPGQTVAFVGSSGSGKSTCMQLMQRFYDPTGGSIMLDKQDVKRLNVKWLRKQLGVVNQEPVLFATSILENIKCGKENSTREDVVRAAKDANAHKFIMALPEVSKAEKREFLPSFF